MSDFSQDTLVNHTAETDFNRARTKAVLSRLQHFLHTDRDKLLSFNAVKDVLKPKNESYKGMQVVPLEKIVGSEGRYRDFNRYFLPRSDFLRSRWQRVDQAHLKEITLPPVQLYEIGGAYFVRDGNHRVSVAKSQGVESIDAEVTSMSSEIAIEPGMTVDQLREKLIQYEKELFYEKTAFGTLTGDYQLDFSTTGTYDVIYNHILVHKYFMNQCQSEELPLSDAIVSWYNNVYVPIIHIIKDEWIQIDFPGSKSGDLYIWIVKYWDFLKKKYGIHYSISCAVKDFRLHYGQRKGRFFRFLIAICDKWLQKTTQRLLKKTT
ncbi:hypothetical protein FACS1894164_17220 [Spirochaetia bacterium]|nr:hypothetical protein FACS1894164_17220 [Spirochaetia bacterium]